MAKQATKAPDRERSATFTSGAATDKAALEAARDHVRMLEAEAMLFGSPAKQGTDLSAMSVRESTFGLETLTGTPEQVRASLGHTKADRVIALTLEDSSTTTAEALEQTITRMVPLMGAILKVREESALASIVEVLVPRTPPAPHLLMEAAMVGEARRAVLDSGDWLTAANVAKVAGLSTVNASAQPNKWKRDEHIFALRHKGVDYFPGYALDPSRGYRPVKELGKVLAMFRDKKDDWGIAYWFASVNSFLGGRRPQDLLVEQPERVLAAAEDEVAGVLHG